MASQDLPEASAGDDRPRVSGEVRAVYRGSVALLATTLAALLLGRGYGLDTSTAAGAEIGRRTDGEWVSVPWQVAGVANPQQLQLTVDPGACARVVRYEVTETPAAVYVTVWRRTIHPACVPLTVAVRLRAPLAGRSLMDGGVVTTQ